MEQRGELGLKQYGEDDWGTWTRLRTNRGDAVGNVILLVFGVATKLTSEGLQ